MLLSERSLYLLFTPELCRGEPRATLAAALAHGVDLVQWRVKAPDPAGFALCQRLCAEAGVPLIVNDDVMLAVRSGAAGVHLGQDDMPAEASRRLLPRTLLGVSTHDAAQIARAAAAGADYVGFGPCFPTATKGYTVGQGLERIAAAVDAAGRLPLFAIGGITAQNLPALRGVGVDRIAVSSAVLASEDPGAAVRELVRLL
ncbi:MAG: thiamine phosphate synthase [Planctomycetes bacterium]|nr:thiamine phosphate synthase [Planctomycetota bacterium]